jgi:putative redox protein
MTQVRPDNLVHIAWAGEHRFDAGRPGGPQVRIDASAETGPSPVDAVLIGLGSCTSVDVVDILAKRRTPVTAFNIEVQAERRETSPRRVLKAHLVYRIDGQVKATPVRAPAAESMSRRADIIGVFTMSATPAIIAEEME